MSDWPFKPPIVPMEAEVADRLPPPPNWSYEPKWDGFRVVIWSLPGGQGGHGPRLDSRNAKPLLRYFPELDADLRRLPPGTVADGEVVVVTRGKLDFDALQNRIHPAESRVRMLAEKTPARIALFDLLALRGEDLRGLPLVERRALLVSLASELGAEGAPRPLAPAAGRAISTAAATQAIPGVSGATGSGASGTASLGDVSSGAWLLSPSTTDIETARIWFRDFEAAGFDGIVAKRLDRPYAEGRREMIKVKHRRTVDCVVGGYRVRTDGRGVGSLLLGLYNELGELHFIGHCSSFSDSESIALLEKLRALRSTGTVTGFGEHARRPGGLSRWTGDKNLEFFAVAPELVVEITYDQLTGDRFRHATRFERWRPDKNPRNCTMGQLERPAGPGLESALELARGN